MNKFPILSEQEEYRLANSVRDNCSKAVESAKILVTSHLRLVVKIAYSYKGYGLPMMDVISEGNIGLMKAVKRFDVTKGFRLSTYAICWIKASIQEYVLHSWSLVKMGTTVGQKKLFFNLRKLKNKLLSENEKYLSNDDVKVISEQLGVKESEIIDMDSRLYQGDVSLNSKEHYDSNHEKIDSLISDDGSIDNHVIEENDSDYRLSIIYQAIELLSEREKYIIINRKIREDKLTLEYIANKYSISVERVRQIEMKAWKRVTAKVFELIESEQSS